MWPSSQQDRCFGDGLIPGLSKHWAGRSAMWWRLARGQNVLAALGQVGDCPSPEIRKTPSLEMERAGLRSVHELRRAVVVSQNRTAGGVLLKEVGAGGPWISKTSESTAINLGGDSTVAVVVFQREVSNALDVSNRQCPSLFARWTASRQAWEVQRIARFVAITVRERFNDWNQLARCGACSLLLVLLVALGKSRLALVRLWRSRLPDWPSITVYTAHRPARSTRSLVRHGARPRTCVG